MMLTLPSCQLFLEIRARLPHLRLRREEYLRGDGQWDREKMLLDLELVDRNRNAKFEPVVDSSAFAALMDEQATCAARFRAACRIFPERKWCRRDYQTGGTWNRRKLERDLVTEAGMQQSTVWDCRLLQCEQIFDIIEAGDLKGVLQKDIYQRGGYWRKERLRRHIRSAMELVVDDPHAAEPYKADETEQEAYMDSSDEDTDGDPDSKAEPFQITPRPPSLPPPKRLMRDAKRQRTSKTDRRPVADGRSKTSPIRGGRRPVADSSHIWTSKMSSTKYSNRTRGGTSR